MLAVLSLGALIGGSLWVLWPFFGAIIWATMVVVATWPMLLGLQARLWNRRWLAVLVLTSGLLLLMVVPLSLAVATIVEHADDIVGWGKWLSHLSIPPAPDWLAGIPLIGPKAATLWGQAAAKPEDLAAKIAPYAGHVASWFAAQVGSAGLIIMQFVLTVIVAAILYANGEAAAAGVLRFGRRLAGERGEAMVGLAGRAIRGVALGIVVTALVQSVLGGIGLAVAGVPFAMLLSGVMFILCIAQLGPVLVLVPAVLWLFFWSGDNVWGTVLLVWTVIVGTLDNLLRPILIRKGADLPLLLIFAGVVGGLIAFGLIGIFVGPVVLAVTYKLLEAWIEEAPQSGEAPSPGEPPSG